MKGQTPLGQYRHQVIVQAPGPAIPDPEGGFTQVWADLVPATWFCSIDPATARDLERVQGGTTISTNTYIVKGAYRADLTTGARLIFHSRRLNVTGVSNPEERNIESVLVAVEVVA